MQLAPSPVAPSNPDAIAWALVELRGPRPDASSRPVDVLEVSAHADRDGLALVHSGTFDSADGPVRRHTTWFTDELLLIDGADPDLALRDARQAVAELVATIDAVAPRLGEFARQTGARVPREAESVEIVLRRASGAHERYVIPLAKAPAGLGDAISAARLLGSVARRYFRENDSPQG